MNELKPSHSDGQKKAAAASTPQRHGTRLLLIEDEPVTRLVLLDKFRTIGLEVDVASNGYLGLEKLRQSHPDAIFMDLLLPDNQGVEVIQEARRDPEFGSRPIYVCTTAARMDAWSQRALEAGATKVFDKGITAIDAIIGEVAANVLGSLHRPHASSTASPQGATSGARTLVQNKLAQDVAWLCTQLPSLAESQDKEARARKCRELGSKVNSVASTAAGTGMSLMVRGATALQSFLKDLSEEAQHFTDTTVRTLTSAVETLELLSRDPEAGAEPSLPEFTAVVVDGNLASRTAISNSLRNVGFRLSAFATPAQAMDHLGAHPADLVVLDSTAAEQSSLDLCESLRTFPLHGKTPVILAVNPGDLHRFPPALSASGAPVVTPPVPKSLTAKAVGLLLKTVRSPLSSRALSNRPTEVVVKPIVAMELSLKALSVVLKNQVADRVAAAAAAPVSAAGDLRGTDLRPSATESQKPASTLQPARRFQQALAEADAEPVSANPGGTVLTVNQAGKIVSADEACAAMFGWQGAELVGQDLQVLLKEPLQSDLADFLRCHNVAAASEPEPLSSLVGRRKDGAEFSTLVSTLTWGSETTLTRKADDPRFCWTLIFRPPPVRAGSFGEMAASPPADHDRAAQSWASPVHAASSFQGPEADQACALEELQKRFEAASSEALQLGESLAAKVQAHDALAERLQSIEAEAQEARTKLQCESKERTRLESQLQAFRAKSPVPASQSAGPEPGEEAGARAGESAPEGSDLRKQCDELSAQLAAAQQAVAESRSRIEELEVRLRTSLAEAEEGRARLGEQTADRQRLESAWRDQIGAAESMAKKMEAAWLEEAGRNKGFDERLRAFGNAMREQEAERHKRLEAELAGLRKVREELAGKLTAEQQAAGEARRRVEEVEGRLRSSAEEMQRITAALEQQTADRDRLESEWRTQLDTAKALTKKLETSWVEAVERNKRFEQELGDLRQVRDDLEIKLTAEKQSSAESKRRSDELELRLHENAAELEVLRAELSKAGHTKRFEKKLANLQQVRDGLSGKLTKEQRAVAESRQRSTELENQLQENTVELERIKAARDQQAEEQASLESSLRAQLNAAHLAAEQAEVSLKERAAQCSRIEQELSDLRQVRDDLNGKLTNEQRAASESKQRSEELEVRLRESVAEADRVKAEQDQHTVEQACLQAELHAQLNAAKVATEQMEAALNEQTAQCSRFESDLASLRRERQELRERYAAEHQAAAAARRQAEEFQARLRESAAEYERVQVELARQTAERQALDSDLHTQLKAAKAATDQAEAAWLEEAERSRRQEEQLTSLRAEREALNGKLTAEQQTATTVQQRIAEMESRLKETTVALDRARTEQDHQNQERTRLQPELNAAQAAAQQATAALKAESEQRRKQEEQLKSFQQERDALSGQLAAQQQAATQARQRAEELEGRLCQAQTDLERARTEQDHQSQERTRLQPELDAAQAAAQQAAAALKTESEQRRKHEEQLKSFQQERDALTVQLAAEQLAATTARQRAHELETRLQLSAAALDQARTQTAVRSLEALDSEMGALPRQVELSDFEQRIREAVISLARTTADLEKERGERRRMEQRNTTLASQLQELHEELKQHLASERASQNRLAELEHQVHEREQAMARSSADAHKERTERQLAEQQLRASGDLSGQLRNCLAAFEEAQKAFKRRQEELQARLQASLHTVSESEARLQKETSERQRLEEALAGAQRQVQEQTENTAMECSRLQSVLELEQSERKRLEGNALQSRYASLDSTRVGLTMMNRLRRQIRPPVDQLLESTRHLLELPLEEEPKKLIETVLENALLLQSNLQESVSLNTGPAGNESAGPTPLAEAV